MQMQTPVAPMRPGCAPRVVIESLFRRKRLLVWTVFVILLFTVAITLSTPKQYASEMKFLIQNMRGNVVVSAERTNSASAPNDVTDAQVNSELEILRSHDVVDLIADPEWAAKQEQQDDPEAARHHQKLLENFEKRLRTEAIVRSNIISVTVLGSTPNNARAELTQLSAAYLAEHRRLQRPGGSSQFFASQTERIRKDWDEASQKLITFQQEHQLLSLSNREAALEARIQEQERDLSATDTTLTEIDAKLSGSSRQLQEVPMRQTTEEKVLPNPESLGHLNTLLVELQNRRTALLTNYKADDRAVRELDQQIATTQAALNDATRMTAREETTNVDPAWEQLHKDSVETEIARQQARAHRATVNLELSSLTQQLANLQGLTVQFNNLEAQANRLKDSYDLYAQKRDQAQVEDAMDEGKLLNVTVAQRPTLSYEVARPKRLANILVALGASVLLGLCLMYFSEISRGTIATPGEFDRVSRHPLLATVPRISMWGGNVAEPPRRLSNSGSLTLGIPASTSILAKGGDITKQNAEAQSHADINVLPTIDAREIEDDQLLTRYEGFLFRIIAQFNPNSSKGHVVMLTSSNPGAGVSQITNSLANLLNRDGGRAAVALNCRHLEHAQRGATTPTNGSRQREPENTSAPDNALRAIGNVHAVRDSFVVSLEKLRDKYRYVLVDCPSLQEAQDAVLLAPLVDGIVVVVEADRTRVEQLSHTEKTLESAKGKILGHILNKRMYVIPDWLFRRMEAAGI
jgi:uncharacterized protein involved in exopolysaccharide biosynthesis/Mrp family chromosome partitioning ATPase